MSNIGLNDGYGEPTREDEQNEEITYEDIYESKTEKKIRTNSYEENRHYYKENPNILNLNKFIELLDKIIDTARKTYYSFNTNVVLPITTYKRLEQKRKSLEDIKKELIKKNQGQEKKSIFSMFLTPINRKIKLIDQEIESINLSIWAHEKYKFNNYKLTLVFSEFNNFYSCVFNIIKFIQNYIGVYEYNKFITDNMNYLNNQLNYLFILLQKVYLLIFTNTYEEIKLDVNLTPIDPNLDIKMFNTLFEYFKFFKSFKKSAQDQQLIKDSEDSQISDMYSVGGRKQSTKKVRMLAKARHFLPKPTRGKKKNKARREKKLKQER